MYYVSEMITIISYGYATPIDYVLGNLEVDKPGNGIPSLDTGLYIMSQEVPFDGFIKAVNACAFLTDPNLNPQNSEITLGFLVAGYQLIRNNFQRVTDTLFFSISVPVGEVLGCNTISLISAQQTKNQLYKGNRPGILFLQEECQQTSLQPPQFFCPAHVNLVDPNKNCSQSLYFNNTGPEDGFDAPAELIATNGHPVDVFINVDFVIGKQ